MAVSLQVLRIMTERLFAGSGKMLWKRKKFDVRSGIWLSRSRVLLLFRIIGDEWINQSAPFAPVAEHGRGIRDTLAIFGF